MMTFPKYLEALSGKAVTAVTAVTLASKWPFWGLKKRLQKRLQNKKAVTFWLRFGYSFEANAFYSGYVLVTEFEAKYTVLSLL